MLLLGLATAAALLGFTVDAAPLRWGAALAAAAFPVALIGLADRRRRLRWPLALLWLVLTGGLLLLVALPHGGPDSLFGLPLGTVVMLFGLVPIPFALVVWTYAARFELRAEDLDRLRGIAEARRLRGEE
ncbi:MAG TPA: hypothetical protein DD490_09390 [Acidobacteria bacterium]|nr:hypothetical protein [Acidobacteriota bacterium]